MKEQTTTANIQVRKLEPNKNMHLKNVKNGDIYESAIYLGSYDIASNYVEVTEEEYQDYLKQKEKESHANNE